MAGKREKPEDIVIKLRQVEVVQGQGTKLADGDALPAQFERQSDRPFSAA